jgi:hypothetical protein
VGCRYCTVAHAKVFAINAVFNKNNPKISGPGFNKKIEFSSAITFIFEVGSDT